VSALTAAKDAIAAELVTAQSKFAPFNSDHEGYAVILEESNELDEEMPGIEEALRHLWSAVRRNDRIGARAHAETLAMYAERAAAEAIQTAAMAHRFLADLPGTEDTA
jgi:hypothetical protein